jgi:hypothetical protein
MNRTALMTGLDGIPLQANEIGFATGLTGHPVNMKKVNVFDVEPIDYNTKNIPQVVDYSTRNSVLPCYSYTHKILKNPPAEALNKVQSMNSTTVYNPRPTDIPIQMPRGFTNPASTF